MKFLYILLLYYTVYSQSTGLKFTRLTEDVYVYTNYKLFSGVQFPSNSMYVVTENGVVLFDTPWDENQFQPLLDSIKKRHNKEVVLCVATHFHDDSSAGLDYYKSKGIRTYTSKQTYNLSIAKGVGGKAEFTFERDTVFKIGTKTFETFYPGEGHSADNIVIWIDKEKVLYGGCLIKSTEAVDLGNLEDASLEKWQGTIKNVMKKYPKPAYVVPGHFAWTQGDKSLKHTLKLLREKEKK